MALSDFTLILLITCTVLGCAVSVLRIRDRLSLRPGMSKLERHQAMQRNSAKTTNWWHIMILIVILVSFGIKVPNTHHQQDWLRIVEVAAAAFLVFRYYRKRSEERIEPHSSSGKPIS